MREQAGEIWKYNDPENYELQGCARQPISASDADCIAIGGGIDELLGQIVRLVIEPGVPVVTSLGGYPTFNFHVTGFGGRLVTVPYASDREDLDGLLDAVKRENAPLVYFANPDNPMGSWWDADKHRGLCPRAAGNHDAHPRRGLQRNRAGRIAALDRRADRPAERRSHAHLLQGLRPRRRPGRLCHLDAARRRAPSTRSAIISA